MGIESVDVDDELSLKFPRMSRILEMYFNWAL